MPCNCPPTSCDCPVELILCEFEHLWRNDDADSIEVPDVAIEHWGAWDRWSGQDEFDSRLAFVYQRIDPVYYCNPPIPATASPYLSRKLRIEAMRERVATGLSPFCERDLQSGAMKIGERMATARNGAAMYHGLEALEQGGIAS